MVKKTFKSLETFYRVFTSGLTSAEIEKLVNDDARGMYTFYVKNMPVRAPNESRIVRSFKFCWYLFVAFLLKLTPARRLFYAISAVLAALAFVDDDLMKGLYAFLILNFLLALELADKLVTRDELEFARQIQLSLLPDQISPVPGFSVSTHSEVAQNVGGDYYDFIRLADGSTAVVIGDVSGKGISAALYMVKVQTALQLIAREAETPRELLVRLNKYLYGKLRRNFFLTISLLQVFPDGTIRFCRAGHMPALLWKEDTRSCTWLQPRGTAIGLAPPEGGDNGQAGPSDKHTLFDQSLETETVSLRAGDSILLYTDGLIETINRSEEEFGEARLMQTVLDASGEEPEAVKTRILNSINRFRNGEELRDDTTFVILRRSREEA